MVQPVYYPKSDSLISVWLWKGALYSLMMFMYGVQTG